MKLDRLLSIVMLLLYRRNSTVAELASRFSVSERTIYRDLETLDLAGFPIVSSVGRGGGIGLLPGYRLEKRFLSAETLSLFSASLSAIGDIFGEEGIAEDRRVLEGLVGDEVSPISLSFGDPGFQKFKPFFSATSRALRDARCLTIEYVGGDGSVSSRLIEPLRLAWIGTDWYLQAWCRLRGDYRLFRIRRVRSFSLSDEKFDRASRLDDLPDPTIESDPGVLPPARIVLCVGASRTDLRQRLAAEIIERNDDLSFTVEYLWPINDWVVSWILGLGPDVVVREPESLRATIAGMAEAMANTYKNAEQS